MRYIFTDNIDEVVDSIDFSHQIELNIFKINEAENTFIERFKDKFKNEIFSNIHLSNNVYRYITFEDIVDIQTMFGVSTDDIGLRVSNVMIEGEWCPYINYLENFKDLFFPIQTEVLFTEDVYGSKFMEEQGLQDKVEKITVKFSDVALTADNNFLQLLSEKEQEIYTENIKKVIIEKYSLLYNVQLFEVYNDIIISILMNIISYLLLNKYIILSK